MGKAQVIHRLGPPDVMQWEDWPVADPAAGEVRLRHTAVGVNYADTYHRGGISHPWPVPDPPVVIGFEGVGVVEGVGGSETRARENAMQLAAERGATHVLLERAHPDLEDGMTFVVTAKMWECPPPGEQFPPDGYR